MADTTTAAPRPSAKNQTRDQIIVEAAGDPAVAAGGLKQLASDQAVRSEVIGHSSADTTAKENHPTFENWAQAEAAFHDSLRSYQHARRLVEDAPPADVSSEEQAALKGLEDAHYATYRRVLAYAPKSEVELAAKMLLIHEDSWDPEGELEAFTRDAERLRSLDSAAWDAAVAAYQAADRAHTEEGERQGRLRAELDRRCPVPEELRLGGIHQWRHCEDLITEDRALPIERRAELVQVLRNYNAEKGAVEAELGITDADPSDATFDARADAFEAIMALTPPDMAGLALQQRLLIEHYHLEWDGEAADDVVTASRLLGVYWSDGRGAITLYRNTLRLAGLSSPVLDAIPFDPAGWLADFEALPGHEVGRFGVAYRSPEAWPGYLGDEPFTVRDPARVEMFRKSRDWPDNYESPKGFILGDRDQIAEIYADDPAEIARLEALWDEQKAIRDAEPQGAQLWRGLTRWQKEAVRDFAKEREPYLERVNSATGRSPADRWLSDWREAGGTVDVTRSTGEFWIGCDPMLSDALIRLRDEITENIHLRSAVRRTLQAEGE